MDDQSAVIAFLADAASYGLQRGAVERIDTHCSIVFLAGDRVYKLKRAVAYSYLDYSTLALRERYCRAELALNRRTAPDLYVAVHPIVRRPDGRLNFDGDGEVLDWVVELRRFDEEGLFDRLAQAQRLTPALMRALADAIADFHAKAEIVTDFGGRAGIGGALAGNDLNLRQFYPACGQRLIARLHAAATALLETHGALLDRRRDKGKVRRCHGDLHLRNVCLIGGRPTLFDCIEFNDQFACIDVLYDVAFLLMDLEQRGLGDLGNTAFNRYLDLNEEVDGLPALPLFMSSRAAIRAHNFAALAHQQDGNSSGDAAARARAYLRLAYRVLRSPAPRMIAIGGLSGTGKSTLAQVLAPEFRPAPGARLIRSDMIRKRLKKVPPETRLSAEHYGAAEREAVYVAMVREIYLTLTAGYTCIVDATFLRSEDRAMMIATADTLNIPFIGLWLDAPEPLLRARIAERHGDPSDADLAVLERQLTLDAGRIDWHRIDASTDVATIAAAARACIARGDPRRQRPSNG